MVLFNPVFPMGIFLREKFLECLGYNLSGFPLQTHALSISLYILCPEDKLSASWIVCKVSARRYYHRCLMFYQTHLTSSKQL